MSKNCQEETCKKIFCYQILSIFLGKFFFLAICLFTPGATNPWYTTAPQFFYEKRLQIPMISHSITITNVTRNFCYQSSLSKNDPIKKVTFQPGWLQRLDWNEAKELTFWIKGMKGWEDLLHAILSIVSALNHRRGPTGTRDCWKWILAHICSFISLESKFENGELSQTLHFMWFVN